MDRACAAAEVVCSEVARVAVDWEEEPRGEEEWAVSWVA